MGSNEYGAYDAEVLTAIRADAALTATTYNATAGDLHVFTARQPLLIMGFGCQVSTAYTAPTTAQVVALDYRPSFGSDTGRVEKGRITMNTARAAGTVINKRVTPFKIKPGEQVVIEQVTAGSGGQGAAHWFVLACPVPETSKNCPNVVEL